MTDQGSEVTSTKADHKATGSSSGGQIVDSTPVTITNQKLHGNNYLAWSRAVELFITGRGKKDYLSEKMTIPSESDEKFPTWEAENSMIMSWLLGSMTADVSNTFMLYPTTAAIWKATREMYSKTDNILELYELEAQLKDIKQGDQSVSKYFGSLSQVWQQIDALELYQWGCPADDQLYKKIKETRRIFGFLSGLHKAFDVVRGRVLGTKPLPTMTSAFSEVRQEESRMKVMMGSVVSSTVTSESSALNVRENEKESHVGLVAKKSGAKDNRGYVKKYCRYCHRDGHVVEECYRRPGSNIKPPPSFFRHNNFRSNSSGRSKSNNSGRSDADSWRNSRDAVADTGSDADPKFTQAQLDALLRVLEVRELRLKRVRFVPLWPE